MRLGHTVPKTPNRPEVPDTSDPRVTSSTPRRADENTAHVTFFTKTAHEATAKAPVEYWSYGTASSTFTTEHPRVTHHRYDATASRSTRSD